jgi:hypothetical protein
MLILCVHQFEFGCVSPGFNVTLQHICRCPSELLSICLVVAIIANDDQVGQQDPLCLSKWGIWTYCLQQCHFVCTICIPKTKIEYKINTIYHNHTFGGFKCMTLVHNIGFGLCVNLEYPSLPISQLTNWWCLLCMQLSAWAHCQKIFGNSGTNRWSTRSALQSMKTKLHDNLVFTIGITVPCHWFSSTSWFYDLLWQ